MNVSKEKGLLGKPFEELSESARNLDLGQINGLVKVDNIPVAELDAVDYTNNKMNNVSEVYTKQFNATVPTESRMKTEGKDLEDISWCSTRVVCIFKTSSPGNHTVYYQNSVQSNMLTAAGNVNSAQFTYHFKVE